MRYRIWVPVDALTKIFHSLAAGVRVLPLGCVAMSRQLARGLRVHEKNSARRCGINPIMRLQFVRSLAVIDAWAGDKDRAIQQLAKPTYLPGSHISYGYLRLHPLWDPIRGD